MEIKVKRIQDIFSNILPEPFSGHLWSSQNIRKKIRFCYTLVLFAIKLDAYFKIFSLAGITVTVSKIYSLFKELNMR